MSQATKRSFLSFGLMLILGLPFATRLQAQAGPALWLRPQIGFRDGGWTPGVFGLALEVGVAQSVVIVGNVDRWTFDTSCPAEVPSTCGDDGWGLTAGALYTGPRVWGTELLLEPQVGAYRFSTDGREGHTAFSIGGRYGLSFPLGDVRLDVTNTVRHIVGYERGGLSYPSERFHSLQVAVAVGIR